MPRFPTLLLKVALVLPASGLAQDSGNAVSDPRIDELAKQKALLEAQKNVIEAQKDLLTSQKALIDAKYPKIEGGKTGTLTFASGSADSLHAHVQAYDALKTASGKLCAQVKSILSDPTTSVVLVSNDDVKAAGQYRIAALELTKLRDSLAAAPAPSSNGARIESSLRIYSAAAALTALADFGKLFRTDRTLYSESVSLQNAELMNHLALCMRRDFANTKYPAAGLDHVLILGSSAFLKELDDLGKKIDEASALVAKGKDEPRAAYLSAIAEKYNAFRSGLITSGESDKTPNIFHVLLGELVASAVTQDKPLLTAAISKQGGFSMVTSSIWRQDRLYSSGGAVVSYKLSKGDQLLAADSIGEDSALREIQKSK